jgi:protein involved in polysaccharide export with SLBB domain
MRFQFSTVSLNCGALIRAGVKSALAVVAALVLAGCEGKLDGLASQGAVTGVKSEIAAVAPATGNLPSAPNRVAAAMPPAANRISSGDKVRISVFGEDRLSGEFLVDSAGNASLPLIGSTPLGGMTTSEAEAALRTKLSKEYVRNAKVTVEISALRPFYIIGAVEKPGEYPYRPGMNVMMAIAIAGGNTYRASPSTILIQRAGTNVESEYQIASSVVVNPGDLIRVPERMF